MRYLISFSRSLCVRRCYDVDLNGIRPIPNGHLFLMRNLKEK